MQAASPVHILCTCRRNNGRTATIHRRADGQAADFVVDNRWVAPYNPFMSELFDCHINVEVVAPSKQSSIYINMSTRAMIAPK